MADEVGYVENGPQGKTCAVCANYTPSPENPDVGKCLGHDVQASASCNYFESRSSAQ